MPTINDALHFSLLLVCLVTYDMVKQKELLQTKFHRSNESILSLAKDLVQIEQARKSDESLNPHL